MKRVASGSAWKRGEPLPGRGIVQHQVTLAESAPLDVLPGQADRGAVGKDRGEGKRLGVCPVDAAIRAQRRP